MTAGADKLVPGNMADRTTAAKGQHAKRQGFDVVAAAVAAAMEPAGVVVEIGVAAEPHTAHPTDNIRPKRILGEVAGWAQVGDLGQAAAGSRMTIEVDTHIAPAAGWGQAVEVEVEPLVSADATERSRLKCPESALGQVGVAAVMAVGSCSHCAVAGHRLAERYMSLSAELAAAETASPKDPATSYDERAGNKSPE